MDIFAQTIFSPKKNVLKIKVKTSPRGIKTPVPLSRRVSGINLAVKTIINRYRNSPLTWQASERARARKGRTYGTLPK